MTSTRCHTHQTDAESSTPVSCSRTCCANSGKMSSLNLYPYASKTQEAEDGNKGDSEASQSNGEVGGSCGNTLT